MWSSSTRSSSLAIAHVCPPSALSRQCNVSVFAKQCLYSTMSSSRVKPSLYFTNRWYSRWKISRWSNGSARTLVCRSGYSYWWLISMVTSRSTMTCSTNIYPIANVSGFCWWVDLLSVAVHRRRRTTHRYNIGKRTGWLKLLRFGIF